MKTASPNSGEEMPKTGHSKSSKKSAKSRSKSSKSESGASSGGKNATVVVGPTSACVSAPIIANIPTTPTTTHPSHANEAPLVVCSGGIGEITTSSKHNQHRYAGLEARTIKNIWDQHDQGDMELSQDVCARLAEDASYKLWELINNVKIYSRHSGGPITYDMVNEVLRTADVPPLLGAMDSEWERIDFDGSYFFYSDKIIELRDEYQKQIDFTMMKGPEWTSSWPMEEQNMDSLKKFLPSLFNVVVHGETKYMEVALIEAAFSPIMATCYRVLLVKIIQLLAFKQHDASSMRCWQLLRACAVNPFIRGLDCRKELFNLTEIFICQLLAPYEAIKGEMVKKDQPQDQNVKMEDVKLEESVEVKTEYVEPQETFQNTANAGEEKNYKLLIEDDDDMEPENTDLSPYYATPVDWKYVDVLCETIGRIAAVNGYFQVECMFHITRRLERFFESRTVNSEREYNYISRAVRGLVVLGDYAFREFIPFAYKFNVDDVPETLWNHFSVAATYLNGSDDMFLYEWLECLCGDKLQPFMVYYAHYYDKFLNSRLLKRKPPTFKIIPKQGVRRLEWNSLAAAMCHGDDPNKALKPKPTMSEMFPELKAPNLQINRPGRIRFKFSGCRPIKIKPKKISRLKVKTEIMPFPTPAPINIDPFIGQNDILIARRKLLKPLTNERRVVHLSSYYFLRL